MSDLTKEGCLPFSSWGIEKHGWDAVRRLWKRVSVFHDKVLSEVFGVYLARLPSVGKQVPRGGAGGRAGRLPKTYPKVGNPPNTAPSPARPALKHQPSLP
jgi:hypothetical protein